MKEKIVLIRRLCDEIIKEFKQKHRAMSVNSYREHTLVELDIDCLAEEIEHIDDALNNMLEIIDSTIDFRDDDIIE